MHLTYDQESDLAYLRLRGEDEEVGRVSSVPIRPPGSEDAVAADLVLDFDSSGHLVGIEFLDPNLRLVPSVLAASERRA